MIERTDFIGDLPRSLYRAEQVRAMDNYAINTLGMSGFVLMENAGSAAFKIITDQWPNVSRLVFFCGGGNNGGDGYIVAKLALEAGFKTEVFSLPSVSRLTGDAKLAYEDYITANGEIKEFKEKSLENCDLIIDALLGTGLDRNVGGRYEHVINSINCAGMPVLSIDIPSGIHADTGFPMGTAVRAHRTVTFIGLKQGLVTGQGPEYCGQLHFSSLGVPDKVWKSQKPSAELITFDRAKFASRRKDSHKGNFGHVLVIGGDKGYTGAVRLAAEAACRVGAGLVSVATRDDHAAMINLMRSEVMCRGAENEEDLQPLLKRATVIAIGPGLGQNLWGEQMLNIAYNQALPLIIDADGLNLLGIQPRYRDNWILTPHPGEAARLLNTTVTEIEKDRFAAAKNIQQQFGGICVLKGPGTIVYESGIMPAVCNKGNPGMATGGMGDVLTGVIAGLLAQGLSMGDAARLGTYIHSAAADEAAEAGQRGLLAGDLMIHLRGLVNP